VGKFANKTVGNVPRLAIIGTERLGHKIGNRNACSNTDITFAIAGQHWNGQPNQETNEMSAMISQEFSTCSNTWGGWKIRKAGSNTHTDGFGTVDHTCRNRIGSNINL